MYSGLSTWCAVNACCMALKIGSVLPRLARRPRLRELGQPHLQPLRHRVRVQQPVQRRGAGARQAHHEDRPLDRYVGVLGVRGELRPGSAAGRPARSSPPSAGSSCRAASARPRARPGPRPGPAAPPRGRSPPRSDMPGGALGGRDDVLVATPTSGALAGHHVAMVVADHRRLRRTGRSEHESVVELAAVDGQHLAGDRGGQVGGEEQRGPGDLLGRREPLEVGRRRPSRRRCRRG